MWWDSHFFLFVELANIYLCILEFGSRYSPVIFFFFSFAKSGNFMPIDISQRVFSVFYVNIIDLAWTKFMTNLFYLKLLFLYYTRCFKFQHLYFSFSLILSW